MNGLNAILYMKFFDVHHSPCRATLQHLIAIPNRNHGRGIPKNRSHGGPVGTENIHPARTHSVQVRAADTGLLTGKEATLPVRGRNLAKELDKADHSTDQAMSLPSSEKNTCLQTKPASKSPSHSQNSICETTSGTSTKSKSPKSAPTCASSPSSNAPAVPTPGTDRNHSRS